MSLDQLPTLNAILNVGSAILLTIGYAHIRAKRVSMHKRFMLAALVASGLFLTSYLIYHSFVGHVPYPHQDWTRPLYFAILIPHVILAALMTPFIVTGVVFAFRKRFDKHRRLMRVVLPVWLFVSVSGVAVYLMLYQL